MKYAYIERNNYGFNINHLCKAMKVSESGYYRWKKHKVSNHKLRDQYLGSRISSIFNSVKGRYGSPRVRMALKDEGEHVSLRRIQRLMQERELKSPVKRKYKVTTIKDPSATARKNILDRNFITSAPNQAWVSDITYIQTQEGWLYLVIILDLFARKVVSWQTSSNLKKEFVIECFLKVYWQRKPGKKLIFHSDRGSQYTSKEFQKILSTCDVSSSMSGAGSCYDNAVAESFFKSLKTELKVNKIYKSKEEARNAIFEYIESFYNPVRKHSTLNYFSPDQYEYKFVAGVH